MCFQWPYYCRVVAILSVMYGTDENLVRIQLKYLTTNQHLKILPNSVP